MTASRVRGSARTQKLRALQASYCSDAYESHTDSTTDKLVRSNLTNNICNGSCPVFCLAFCWPMMMPARGIPRVPTRAGLTRIDINWDGPTFGK